MIETINSLDSQLFLYLNSLGSESFDGFWLFVTNKWTSIPLYLLALFLVYKHYGLKGALVILAAVALMIATTDQLSNVFKDGFKRPRPCQVESFQSIMRMIAVRCGKYGFFSAHAASSVAVSVFLSLLLRKKYLITPYLLLIWCAIVSYSRIYVGVHYPTDIIFGGLVGIGVGIAYYKILGMAYLKIMKCKVEILEQKAIKEKLAEVNSNNL